jgi:hypothetical protein
MNTAHVMISALLACVMGQIAGPLTPNTGDHRMLALAAADASVSASQSTEVMPWFRKPIIHLDGERLLAMNAALGTRQNDKSLSRSERDLRNFLITVSNEGVPSKPGENTDNLIVAFTPKYASGETEKLHGATRLGRRLFYVVRLSDLAVIRQGDSTQEMRRQ